MNHCTLRQSNVGFDSVWLEICSSSESGSNAFKAPRARLNAVTGSAVSSVLPTGRVRVENSRLRQRTGLAHSRLALLRSFGSGLLRRRLLALNAQGPFEHALQQFLLRGSH